MLTHSFSIPHIWGEARVLGTTIHTGTGRTGKLHTEKAQARGSNPQPSCCVETVLTTAPACHSRF